MSIRYIGYGFMGLRRFRVGRVSERPPERMGVDDALCVPPHPPAGSDRRGRVETGRDLGWV